MARQAHTALKVLGGDNPSPQLMEMCRTIGHAWDQFWPQMERPDYGFRFSLRCLRCTTERHDIVDHHGRLYSRVYYWCEGYRLEKGVERPTREDLRKSLFDHMRKEFASHKAVSEAVLAAAAS